MFVLNSFTLESVAAILCKISHVESLEPFSTIKNSKFEYVWFNILLTASSTVFSELLAHINTETTGFESFFTKTTSKQISQQ